MCPPTTAGYGDPLSPHRARAMIFTFDTESPRAMSRCQPSRSSRRPRRVLYPATVRRYLPPQQRDHPKTWLLVLCTVVALQIYSEQPEPLAGEGELASPGLPQDSLGPGLGLNSSHSAHPELEQPPSPGSCAYLQLFVEATALKL